MRNAGWRGEEAGKQGYASNPHIETCSLYKIDLKKKIRGPVKIMLRYFWKSQSFCIQICSACIYMFVYKTDLHLKLLLYALKIEEGKSYQKTKKREFIPTSFSSLQDS